MGFNRKMVNMSPKSIRFFLRKTVTMRLKYLVIMMGLRICKMDTLEGFIFENINHVYFVCFLGVQRSFNI